MNQSPAFVFTPFSLQNAQKSTVGTTVPYGGSTLPCSMEVDVEPKVKLEIDDEHAPLVPHKHVVGQPVTLRMRTNPNVPFKLPLWLVPGADTVAAYPLDGTAQPTCAPTPVGFDGTTSATLAFFWIAPGTKTITALAIVDGEKIKATLTVEVVGPELLDFALETRVARHHPRTSGEPEMLSARGISGLDKEPLAGCDFSAAAAAAAPGHLAFVQTLRSVRELKLAGKALEKKTPECGVLDDNPKNAGFYTAAQKMGRRKAERGGGFVGVLMACDSPSQYIDHSVLSAKVEDRFSLYLVYRPTTPGSIWVTVAKAEWGWECTLDRSDPQTPFTGKVSPGGKSQGQPSSELPVWDGLAQVFLGEATWQLKQNQ